MAATRPLILCRTICLTVLLVIAACESDCEGTLSSDGQCVLQSAGSDANAETSALVQSRLNLKGKISSHEDPAKLVKPHLREFLDENTKFMSGVPVFRYHLVHASGMEPSALELKEQKDWIVEFEDTCHDAALKTFCSNLEGEAHCDLIGHPDEKGIPFVELLASEEELAVLMKKEGPCKIDFVEPNSPISAIPEVEKEEGASLLEEGRGVVWGLDRIDARSGLDGQYSLNGAGQGVIVYIADTGVRCSHNELVGRCTYGADWTLEGGMKECGSSLLETDDEIAAETTEDLMEYETDSETQAGSNARYGEDRRRRLEGRRRRSDSGGGGGSATPCGHDKQGHGTHCAGSVAGKTMGVATSAKIVALKVLGDNGSGTIAGVVGSVDWLATKPGPRIWSASLGGKGTPASAKTTIDKAVAAGVVISVAAGNDSGNACDHVPAFVPNAITVAASDRNDKAASFTNSGKCVDIYAPGVDIVSAGVKDDTGTDKMSGTSMACPHVSGGAAVILGGNPNLSPAEVLEVMLKYATPDKITGDALGSPNKLLYVAADMGGDGGGGGGGGGAPSPPSGSTPSGPCPPGPAGPPGPKGEQGSDGPPGPPR